VIQGVNRLGSACVSRAWRILLGSTGYKVVRVPFDHSTGNPQGEYEDFVTGFVTPDGKVWGRPVGITVAKDGSLLISEDGNGTIWRVSYGR
jgi:glucose/arabinose dehydrogenase